jgi:CspA family cold shock protein
MTEALVNERELGTVLSWSNAEGHGRIRSDSGDVLWSHVTFIDMEGFRTLSPGQRVSFRRVTDVPAPPDERPQAWEVRPVGHRPEGESVGSVL